MKPTTTRAIHIIAPVILSLTATLTFASPQRVTITADEANYATDQTSIYEAKCPSGKFKLRLGVKRVEFDFDGVTRTAVDLSSTPFGKTFLEKGLQGKFEATCPDGALRVYFYGFEPKKGAAMRPVTYRFTIGNNGVIIRDDGLHDESVESINWRFLPREQ